MKISVKNSVVVLALASLIVIPLSSGASAAPKYKAGLKIAMISKIGNIPYFDFAMSGATKACKEIKCTVKYFGPNEGTAAAQIKLINAVVQQGYNGIMISANDKDALVPALKNAMKRGVAVTSWDSDVAKEGRDIFVNQASYDGVATAMLDSVVSILGAGVKGDVGILSSTPDATNQNAWIASMAKQIKANSKYKGINVVATVYGNDDPEKSTTETQGLLQSNPTIKVIVAPTSVGIISAAQYVVARPELKGKVIVTGLGLPTSMAKYIKDGTAQAALWNVPDIGYMSVYAVANIASKIVKTPVKNGSSFSGGYLGSRKSFAGDNGPEIILGPGIIFTPENVDSFKF